MRIQPLHNDFIMPTKGSSQAGAFDIYMPSFGYAGANPNLVGLGFAAEVPDGHIALLLPRSSAGSRYGLELNNTCGVIDSDYRGEWKAMLKTKDGSYHCWAKGERLLQFLIVPVANVTLVLTDMLTATVRGSGGFGSTGS